jgi:peptide/nickel transport system permease protein
MSQLDDIVPVTAPPHSEATLQEEPPVTAPQPEPIQRGAFRRLLRKPVGALSLAYLVLLIIACFGAPLWHLQDPLSQDILNALKTPGADHWLGTDSLGQDVFSRLLYGGRGTLLGALEVIAVGLVLGVPLGLAAGFFGGWIDAAASRFADFLFAVPAIVMVLAVVGIFGNNIVIAMFVVGVIFSGGFLRLVRASTLAVRHELYVDAAHVSGLANARIIARHIFPNVTGPLIIQCTLAAGTALLIEGGLGFIGLGPAPPNPDWGTMISDATNHLTDDIWLMVPPGAILILTILAANFLGDAIRDVLPQAQRGSALATTSVRRRRAGATAGAGSDAVAWVNPTKLPIASAPEIEEDAVLTVRDLTVSFPRGLGEYSVVQDISLSVRAGESIALVGESGCGKTMTALALMGLVPPPGRISRGQIIFDGTDLTRLDEGALNEVRGVSIGLISQEPMVALDPSFTVGSQLREPLRYHKKLSRKAAQERAIELLRLVGIPRPEAVARSYPHQLSGGMAQRVAIAIALSGEPKLLIADEPTTALDVTIQAEILDLLRSLQEQMGMALILVTHDLGVVADMCSRAIVMYAGQVVEEAVVDALFDRPLHPYTMGLLQSMPDLNQSEGKLHTIEGSVPPPQQWPIHCHFADRCPYVIDACRSGPIPLLVPVPERESRCIRVETLQAILAGREAERNSLPPSATPAVSEAPSGGTGDGRRGS